MASHSEEAAINEKTMRVVKACGDNFEANMPDCNKPQGRRRSTWCLRHSSRCQSNRGCVLSLGV
jgi:hypothetical protein